MRVFLVIMAAVTVVVLVAVVSTFADVISWTDEIIAAINHLGLTNWTVFFHYNLPQ